MTVFSGKRPAGEGLATVAPTVELPVLHQRPLPTTLGAALVALRVLTGGAWLAELLRSWDTVARTDLHITGADLRASHLVLWIIVGIGVLVLVLELGVVLFVYLGRNWARIVVMFTATSSIVGSAIGYFTLGEAITLNTTLIALALDILVLLALSSQRARQYARRHELITERTPS